MIFHHARPKLRFDTLPVAEALIRARTDLHECDRVATELGEALDHAEATWDRMAHLKPRSAT